jgi:hypothetical protein
VGRGVLDQEALTLLPELVRLGGGKAWLLSGSDLDIDQGCDPITIS